VRQVMTTRVVFVRPEQNIDECMALMTDKRVRHLPVLEGGKLVGFFRSATWSRGSSRRSSSSSSSWRTTSPAAEHALNAGGDRQPAHRNEAPALGIGPCGAVALRVPSGHRLDGRFRLSSPRQCEGGTEGICEPAGIGRPRPGRGYREREKLKPPPLYKVLLHNDDYTTMEFVVDVLQSVFRRSPNEAVQIMLHVHRNGIGVAGVYTHEVAETKISVVEGMARSHEFPLKCSMEEA